MKKTIIITGAASGIGKEVANMLKDENLILIDRSNIFPTAKKLNAQFYQCDVTNEENLFAVVADIKKKFKKVDTLINCAGVWVKGELSAQLKEGDKAKLTSLSKMKNVILTNTFGVIATIKTVVPLMTAGGQIININSVSSLIIEEFCPVYNASKHGSRAFSQAIEADLAKMNIKLTDICPGLVNTDFYKNAGDPLPDAVMKTGLNTKEVSKIVKFVLDMPKNVNLPVIEIRDMKNY